MNSAILAALFLVLGTISADALTFRYSFSGDVEEVVRNTARSVPSPNVVSGNFTFEVSPDDGQSLDRAFFRGPASGWVALDGNDVSVGGFTASSQVNRFDPILQRPVDILLATLKVAADADAELDGVAVTTIGFNAATMANAFPNGGIIDGLTANVTDFVFGIGFSEDGSGAEDGVIIVRLENIETSFSAVPIPSTLILLFSSLCSIFIAARAQDHLTA